MVKFEALKITGRSQMSKTLIDGEAQGKLCTRVVRVP